MNQRIISLVIGLLTLAPFQMIAQNRLANTVFGLEMIQPNDWGLYGQTAFDRNRNQCGYIFFLPRDSEPTSEWDNSLSIIGRADGFVNSREGVLQSEKQRLSEKFDDLIVINESKRHLLTQATINGASYQIFTLSNYQHGIGYIASFSFRSNTEVIDTNVVKSFFESIKFFKPVPEYEDIDEEIAVTPEDPTLFFKKAKRRFGFYDLKGSIQDLNQAIELFPLYGEAYYLRGYVNLALGDTVEACRDFYSAIEEDYWGESELIDYCNSDAVLEALEDSGEEDIPYLEFDTNANHLAYIDSVRNHKYFIFSITGEPNQEELTYMDHVNHLAMLEYDQLDNLVRTETGILRLYAFSILCNKFSNQISREHKKILKSKEKVRVLSTMFHKSKMKPVKEIASMMYSIVDVNNKEN